MKNLSLCIRKQLSDPGRRLSLMDTRTHTNWSSFSGNYTITGTFDQDRVLSIRRQSSSALLLRTKSNYLDVESDGGGREHL